MRRTKRSARKAARRPGQLPTRGVGQTDLAVLENVAAISEMFHQHPGYEAFYERYAPALSGFPGIWRFVALAGTRFTQFEPTWEDCNWVDCLSKFVESLYVAAMKERPGAWIDSEAWIDPIVKKVFSIELGMEQARQILREVEAMR